MRMIPSIPHRTASLAERRIFDRLEAAFANDDGLRLTAFHSLNLTDHAYKRIGEIDFLIVGRAGIFVLEIKGGGVGCRNGAWHTIDRSGQQNPLRESPFRQAESALYALTNKLQAGLPAPIWSQFVRGYGVILPDCHWSVTSAEWDSAMLADVGTSRNLEQWLEGLFSYWRQRDRHREPDDAALDALTRFLRPDFDVAVPLHVQLDELAERVTALTEDQMRMLDVVDANPRVICCGGAGTGKTFLAMELARRWTALDRKVLLVCRSPWLKRWLETKFALPGVTVAIAHTVSTAARRLGIEHFDALIVDEGQDLLELDALERLGGVLDGALERGRWCFFHDINNQAGFFGAPNPDALALLEVCAPVAVPLTTNCRNTRQILDKVQSTLGADMGVHGSGDGPRVVEHRVATSAEAVRVLAAEIERMIGAGGLLSNEVSLLSPRPLADSVVASLPSELLSRIIALDEYSMRTFPPNGISFAEIRNFKGLENEAIIVVDLPKPGETAAINANHYVGMSRARSLLSMIFSD